MSDRKVKRKANLTFSNLTLTSAVECGKFRELVNSSFTFSSTQCRGINITAPVHKVIK